MTECFKLVDVDNSGFVDFNEFSTFAKARGLFYKKKDPAAAAPAAAVVARPMGMGDLMRKTRVENEEAKIAQAEAKAKEDAKKEVEKPELTVTFDPYTGEKKEPSEILKRASNREGKDAGRQDPFVSLISSPV